MRRLILVLATIGVTVLLASGAALAITNGWADDGLKDDPRGSKEEPDPYTIKYPNVGALVEFPNNPRNPDKATPYPYCSGTLVPDKTGQPVFVTAAHCGNEGEAVKVTFLPKKEDFTRTMTTYAGTFHADPNGYDIAVVEFASNSTPPSTIPTAQLPSFRQFDHVAKGQKFTAVGYGGQEPVKEPGWGWVINYNDNREWAVSTYKSVNQTYLSLSQNLNQGAGGTCYGDSGGPNFFGEYRYDYDNDPATSLPKPTIAGITSTGDTWCKATNVTLRLDIKPVRDFLRAQDVLQVTQCSDGLDNDNDDKIDVGRRGDPDCVSDTDDSESS